MLTLTSASGEKLEAEAQDIPIQVLRRSGVRKNTLDRKNGREERAWEGEADGDLPVSHLLVLAGGHLLSASPTGFKHGSPTGQEGPPLKL